MKNIFAVIGVIATLVLLVLQVTGSVSLSPLVILAPLLLAFVPLVIGIVIGSCVLLLSAIVYLVTAFFWVVGVAGAGIYALFSVGRRRVRSAFKK